MSNRLALRFGPYRAQRVRRGRTLMESIGEHARHQLYRRPDLLTPRFNGQSNSCSSCPHAKLSSALGERSPPYTVGVMYLRCRMAVAKLRIRTKPLGGRLAPTPYPGPAMTA